MSLSNYLEGKYLNCLRGTSFSVSFCYVKLHSADPGEDGTSAPALNTERKQITWAAPVGNAMTNSAEITWPSVPNAETYRWVSLWDNFGPAGGNCLAKGQLAQEKVVAQGDPATFAVGSVTFTLD